MYPFEVLSLGLAAGETAAIVDALEVDSVSGRLLGD